MRLPQKGALVWGGLLDRYVGGLFLSAYAAALFLVVGLAVVLDLASNLDWFETWPDGGRASTVMVLRYYLLQLPFLYLQVAPFVTVVAGLFTVSRIVKHNETVAAMAAGVSAQRVLAPILLGGVVAAVFMFGLREIATETLGFKRDTLYDVLNEQRTERLFEEVFFRDDYGSIVRLGEFRPAAGSPPVADVRGLEATIERGGVTVLISAKRGVWSQFEDGPGWRLEGGLLKEVEDQTRARPIERLEGIDFSPEDVLVQIKSRERTMELSFAELDRLARRDPGNVSYQTLMQYHLTFPLSNLVLLLVALPLLVGRERGKGMEGLIEGTLLCVFYFCVEFITRAMGMDGTLSPLVASWLPILIFGSLGIVLLESMRT
jgi:lipopolysaccharide export LptBFGC system permease protein LptF